MAREKRDFHHPYQPYDVQTQFMNALYDCIENGHVGIFESPTGTGKSLSVICGSLTWLRDHRREEFGSDPPKGEADEDEPDWIVEHARKQRRQSTLRRKADMEARLARARAREKKQQDRNQSEGYKNKRLKVDHEDDSQSDDAEAQFLLDDYQSDDESRMGRAKDPSSTYSAATQKLMAQLGMTIAKREDEEEQEDELKILYCSRTHSQLTQFVNELRRVDIPPAIVWDALEKIGDEASGTGELVEELKHLSLGSRKNLCINPKVAKLGNANAINERCLELQKPGVSTDSKCSYGPNKENENIANEFRDLALAKIRDIEDLGTLGKKMEICPYYASRSAIKPAEIVTLPYPLLLQKSAREALGISLKGHVVIIDEAHNLMDAITNIHSISVSLEQFRRSRIQLLVYLQKFRNRLKGKNRVYVTQLVRLLDSLASYLETTKEKSKANDGIVRISDLMTGKGVDQINLTKLMYYLQESKLARKVEGYNVHVEEERQLESQKENRPMVSRRLPEKRNEGTVPVLTHIQGFLETLTNPSREGQFLFAKVDGDISLQYTLLDPTHHFQEIVEEARAVILAGGTMSPMSDYQDYLFSYLPPDKLQTLSCGHVIPPENLLACPVAKGPNGLEFEFSFEKRNSQSMIDELGAAILSLAQTIPDGLVVFFPSYSYLDLVHSRWTSTGSLHRIAAIKPLFREPREASAVDATLAAYAQAIAGSSTDEGLASRKTMSPSKGALLLAVVGGKMSEGINFSDALGRGVVVVGLPFPNLHTAQWRAKMEYIEQSTYARLLRQASAAETSQQADPAEQQKTVSPAQQAQFRTRAKAAARAFYESTALRAVNQSIGRAIRHQGDYAAIVLLDRRYRLPRIWDGLPGWIVREGGSRVVGKAENQGFRDVVGAVRGFFDGRSGERGAG